MISSRPLPNHLPATTIMNVLDICQEEVSTGFLSYRLARRLRQMQWEQSVNAIESATLDFLAQHIAEGKIIVSSAHLLYSRNDWRQLN
jgi:hypothetical protein